MTLMNDSEEVNFFGEDLTTTITNTSTMLAATTVVPPSKPQDSIMLNGLDTDFLGLMMAATPTNTTVAAEVPVIVSAESSASSSQASADMDMESLLDLGGKEKEQAAEPLIQASQPELGQPPVPAASMATPTPTPTAEVPVISTEPLVSWSEADAGMDAGVDLDLDLDLDLLLDLGETEELLADPLFTTNVEESSSQPPNNLEEIQPIEIQLEKEGEIEEHLITKDSSPPQQATETTRAANEEINDTNRANHAKEEKEMEELLVIKIQEMEGKNKSVQHKNASLQSQVNDLTLQTKLQSSNMACMEINKSMLQTQIDDLTVQTKHQSANNALLQTQVTDLTLQTKQQAATITSMQTTYILLQTQIQDLTAHTKQQSDAISSMEIEMDLMGKPQPTTTPAANATPTAMGPRMLDMQNTITSLQTRIMALVEEKLQLQTTVDRLEHQFVEVDLDKQQNVAKDKKSPEKWFTPKSKPREVVPLPPILIDDDSRMGDILKQTIARKRRESVTGRLSSSIFGNINGGKDEDDDKIDVHEIKKFQAKQAQNRGKTNLSGGRTNLSGGPALDNFLTNTPSLSSNNNTDAEKHLSNLSNDQLESAIDGELTDLTKKESNHPHHLPAGASSPTTWKRISGFIYGGEPEPQSCDQASSSTSPVRPPYSDDSSNNATTTASTTTGFLQEQATIKNLSVPASMLGSEDASVLLPNLQGSHSQSPTSSAFMKSQSTDSIAELRELRATNCLHQQHQLQALSISANSSSSYAHKGPAVGAGMQIDQSNLLTHYVKKQQQQQSVVPVSTASGSTFGYLASMIYGDEEEDIQMQEELLAKQVTRKKRQDQLARQDAALLEQQKAEAAESAKPPRTTLSGRL